MTAFLVDTPALAENLRQIHGRLSPDTVFWAVVKGDGYGLGIEALVSFLLAQETTHFCVTTVEEALAVRALSETAEILMLHPTCDPVELEQLVDANVICTVGSMTAAAVLSAVAQARGVAARVHCKIDTGMGRYGFHPEELPLLLEVYRMAALSVDGIYTHFHSAFCSKKATYRQFQAFSSVIESLRSRGIDPGMCHCCNSSAALAYPEMHMDAVRVGSGLLGRLNDAGTLKLNRIGWCEASVDELHTVPAGGSTGYGAGWRAKRDTVLAILPVGYFHGFAVEKGRDLFRLRDCVRGAVSLMLAAVRRKRLYVTIKGKPYPVRGHVGMLHTAVDVTGSDVRQGDIARLEINPLLQKGLPVVYR